MNQDDDDSGLAIRREADEDSIGDHRWGLRATVGLLVIASTIVGLWALALLWPYADFSYGEVGPIQTDEYTSEGIPVVRFGQPIRWEQHYCNFEANPTTSIRWADIYGQASGSGFVQTEEDLEVRTASFAVPAIVFYGYQNACDVTDVFAVLPGYVTTGSYYRLRIETSYKANPIREPVSEAVTDLFLYLDEGEEIP